MSIIKISSNSRDAYSSFCDTPLHMMLQLFGLRQVFTDGIATEYYVSNAVKDAVRLLYIRHQTIANYRRLPVSMTTLELAPMHPATISTALQVLAMQLDREQALLDKR